MKRGKEAARGHLCSWALGVGELYQDATGGNKHRQAIRLKDV